MKVSNIVSGENHTDTVLVGEHISTNAKLGAIGQGLPKSKLRIPFDPTIPLE